MRGGAADPGKLAPSGSVPGHRATLSVERLRMRRESFVERAEDTVAKKALGHESVKGREPWRIRLGEFLEHSWFQKVVMLLLLVDVILVVFEVLIDLNILGVKGSEETERAERGLKGTSLAILFAFAAEQLLLMVAFGFKYFTKVPFVLDLVVISVSIILEFTVDAEIAGLVVLLRVWRFARIAHGVFVSFDHEKERHHEMEKELNNYISQLQEDLLSLEKFILANGLQVPENSLHAHKIDAGRAGDKNL